MQRSCFKLCPSDFAFLWEECKRCFYLKVVHGFRHPSQPMPKVFNKIDAEMKACFRGKRTEDVAPDLPPGTIEFMDDWVASAPITIPGRRSSCMIRGRFDTMIRFESGSFAVVDFKTAARNDDHIPLYSRQLHAYALSLENPAPDSLRLKPIDRLGLLVFEPTAFARKRSTDCDLEGAMKWIEIACDRDGFRQYLGEVLEVVDSPKAPEPGETCGWCRYRQASRASGF